MPTHPCRVAARVVGSKRERRQAVEAADAFSAYCAADPKLGLDREHYLTVHWFTRDLAAFIERTGGKTEGFAGVHWSPYLWADIDNGDDPEDALDSARRYVGQTLQTLTELDEDDILCFFSGKKGYHVGVPLVNNPEPSESFRHVARDLAWLLAADGEMVVDETIYGGGAWLFRAPNSRHPDTKLYKVRLTHDELMGLSLERIRDIARAPVPFEPCYPSVDSDTLKSLWTEATDRAKERLSRNRPCGSVVPARLQRATEDYLRDGAENGERQTRLFRAAANLMEFAADPAAMVHAILTPIALDTGLSPSEVRHSIESGIKHTHTKTEGNDHE